MLLGASGKFSQERNPSALALAPKTRELIFEKGEVGGENASARGVLGASGKVSPMGERAAGFCVCFEKSPGEGGGGEEGGSGNPKRREVGKEFTDLLLDFSWVA